MTTRNSVPFSTQPKNKTPKMLSSLAMISGIVISLCLVSSFSKKRKGRMKMLAAGESGMVGVWGGGQRHGSLQ